MRATGIGSPMRARVVAATCGLYSSMTRTATVLGG
jgi:hypothetical protein